MGPQGAPASAPTRRSRLATRFQITVHWLLVAAGRTLAIVLLALAGTAEPGTPAAAATWGGCQRRPTPHGHGHPRALPLPAGIAHPSAFSSVYFLVFLATCTWWACHFPISPLGFSALCVTVGCFGAGHLVCVYCYQTPFAQAVLPPAGVWAR